MRGAELEIRAAGGKVRVGRARVVTPDIDATNGVIQVIDHVVLPPAKKAD